MWWNKKQTTPMVQTPVAAGKRTKPLTSSMIMALEPRIMFDGAALATAVDVAHNTADSHTVDAAKPVEVIHATQQTGFVDGLAAPANSGHNVLFVDNRIKDNASLLAGVAPNTEIVYLKQNADGLQQIADYLSANPGAKSIQIIAHGNDGDLWLGNTYISNDTLASHASSLAQIGSGIQTGGDILIYACDTAKGDTGLSFVQSIADLTGHDVAASNDRTGAGSDWDLEVSVGHIEATSVLSSASAANYGYDLSLLTVTSNADAGATTLRGLIASSTAGDTITFNSGMTITLSSGQLLINKNLIIDGDLDDNGTADVTIDANYTSRVLEVTAGTVKLDGLILKHGMLAGVGATQGGAAGSSYGAGIKNAGNLTLSNTTVTLNYATGGGGTPPANGYAGGGGGGGSGAGSIGGATGGSITNFASPSPSYSGASGSGSTGGHGGSYDGNNLAGRGGSSSGGGTGGNSGSVGYIAGGNGGTATIGGIKIGGGGGGAGWAGTGGSGGSAAGGIFNSGTLYVIGNSAITNNGGAGGGGAGGNNGGAGGNAVGGIWNTSGGTVKMTAAAYAAMTGNAAGAGIGGGHQSGGSSGATGTAYAKINTGTGIISTTYVPDAAPVSTTSGGTTAFSEGNNVTSTPAVIDSGFTVTDSDNATLASATVSITGNFHSGEDVLAFTNDGSTMGNITASYNSSTGILTLTSSGATATVAQWQAALRSITYTDTSDTPNTSNRTISFITNDGTLNSNTATKTVSVTSINDTPIATASGGNTSYIEGNNNTTTVVIDSGITVSDLDNTTFASATIAITGGFQSAEDVLAFTNDGSTMGNITASYNSSTGVLTLTSSGATATVAQWQAALRSVTYSDTSNTPNTSNRTISFVINDGSVDSATTTKTVTVTSTNDTPVDNASGGNTAFTEGNNVTSTPVVIDSGFTITDADNSTLASATVAITGNFQSAEDVLAFTNNGSTMGNITASYNSSTGVLTLTSSGATATVAQWQAALRSITYTDTSDTPNTSNRTISFTTNDGTSSGNTVTKTVTVTSVNDTPIATASGGNTAFTEGSNVTSTPVVIDSGLTISDLDSTTLASATVSITGNFQSGEDVLAFTNNGSTMGNITASYNSSTGVLTLTSSGATATVAQWQAALRSVTYTDTSDTPNTSNRTISFVVNDGSVDSATTTKTVTVTSTNDTPVGTTSGGTTAFTEGNNVTSTPVVIDSGFTITDADNSTLASATVAITGNFQSAEDVLAFTNDGSTMGNITASYNSTTGVLTLTSSGATATVAQWQAALRSITYSDTSSTPNTSNRTISFVINDGSADSATTTKTVTVTSTNDTPIGTTSGGTTAFTEGNNVTSTPVVIDSGFSVTDDDNNTLASATVAITGNFQSGEDVLAFTNDGSTMGNITASYNSSTGVLTLTSSGATATLAQWQAALRTVTYVDTADAPNTGNRTISFTINDGSTSSSAATKVVSLAAINDAPVNIVPATQGVDQDAPLIFNSGNGNLISISDTDAGNGTVRVTLTTSHGLLALSSTTGLSFIVGNGANDGTMTFEGSQTDINVALDGLIYTPTAGYHGADSIQITTEDLGLSGSGGSLIDSDTISINVHSLEPVVTNVDTASANGSYKIGDTILIQVTFDQSVNVDTTGGAPTLLLETGNVDRSATYVSGSGSTTLTFSYTVQAGDVSTDLDTASTSALMLNGGTIKSGANYAAILTLPTVGGGQSIGGQHDLFVDGIAPTVLNIGAPDNDIYSSGPSLDFTVNYSEAIVVDTTSGTPRLVLDVGGQTAYADYLSGSGGTALTFRYIVAAGQNDADGIAIASLQTNGGALRDSVGNTLNMSLHGVANTSGIVIDTTPPATNSIARLDATPTSATSVSYMVTFSESVSGLDSGDFTLSRTDSASGTISSVTQVDAHTYKVIVNGLSGSGQIRLDLSASGSNIVDQAGNVLSSNLTGEAYVLALTPPEPIVAPTVITPPPAPIPEPDSTPATPLIGSSTPPITLTALDPVPTTDAPTLNPTSNTISFATNINSNPFTTDPFAGNTSFNTASEGRLNFVEMGVSSTAGLQAIPEIGNFSVLSSEAIRISLPASTFSHSDRDATVTVEVRLIDGRPLPTWLKFDSATGTLTGNPPKGVNQKLQIEIVARDNKGNRASSHLNLEVKAAANTRASLDHADIVAQMDPLEILQLTNKLPSGKLALALQFDQFGRPAQQAANIALLHHLNMSQQSAKV